MIELLLVGIVGIFSGVIVGLLPGFGLTSLLIIFYPLLFLLSLEQLFVFYFAAINSSQYYGSIIAIVFAVPGEISSVPAVKYGHPLYLNNKGSEIVGLTSTGSFLGACISIVILYFVFLLGTNYFHLFLKGNVTLIAIGIMVFIMITTSKNKLLSFILLIFGIYLGKIGFDNIFKNLFVPFEILKFGIPLFPLMLGLLILPALFQEKVLITNDKKIITQHDRIKWLFNLHYFRAILRGTVIGSMTGLIPGVSYLVSSNLAANSEKTAINKVISAETANNAGVVSALLPLILLGIPIIPSEVIILGIAESKGFYVNGINLTNNVEMVCIVLLVINIVNWILSGYFYNFVIYIYSIITKHNKKIITLISLFLFLYLIFSTDQLLLALLTLTLSLLLSFWIKEMETRLYVILGYFISPTFVDHFYRTFII